MATEWLTVADVAPGTEETEVMPVTLPDNQSTVWPRITPEIARANQLILGDAPGTCVFGYHATDLCAPTDCTLAP